LLRELRIGLLTRVGLEHADVQTGVLQQAAIARSHYRMIIHQEHFERMRVFVHSITKFQMRQYSPVIALMRPA
jgi:hypothetical protein